MWNCEQKYILVEFPREKMITNRVNIVAENLHWYLFSILGIKKNQAPVRIPLNFIALKAGIEWVLIEIFSGVASG